MRNKVNIKGDNNQVLLNNKLYISTNPRIEFIEKNIETKNVFAKKMLSVFDSINKYIFSDELINIEKLSALLGFDSTNYLMKFFNTEKEPPFELMELIAEKLGLSENWLKYSQGNPFDYKTIYAFYYMDIISFLKENKDLDIIFLVSDEVDSRVLIYVRYSLYKYQRFRIIYPIHPNVGATGQSQIFDFYKLCKELVNSDFYTRINAYKLRVEIFDAILLGKYFPGCYFKEKERITYFWEDLLDFNYKYFNKDKYEELYTKKFTDVQNIILNRLEREKENG